LYFPKYKRRGAILVSLSFPLGSNDFARFIPRPVLQAFPFSIVLLILYVLSSVIDVHLSLSPMPSPNLRGSVPFARIHSSLSGSCAPLDFGVKPHRPASLFPLYLSIPDLAEEWFDIGALLQVTPPYALPFFCAFDWWTRSSLHFLFLLEVRAGVPFEPSAAKITVFLPTGG